MGQKQHEWSYEGECGPQTWPKVFPGARGNHQSPINIQQDLAVYNSHLKNLLTVRYFENSCSIIKNTGHTFQIDSFQENVSCVKYGPNNNVYSFLQCHMHWGDNLNRGSEHLIDGDAYSAELHFVNWNNGTYKNPKDASQSTCNDGLLVLAVFVKLGKFNPEFENIAKCIHDIHLKDHHADARHININELLPKNLSDFWTYPGSLTTPPCNECVQWIVFKEPIEIDIDQLNQCHKLYNARKEKHCSDNTLIKYNDRPVCSMGDRIVYKSFES